MILLDSPIQRIPFGFLGYSWTGDLSRIVFYIIFVYFMIYFHDFVWAFISRFRTSFISFVDILNESTCRLRFLFHYSFKPFLLMEELSPNVLLFILWDHLIILSSIDIYSQSTTIDQRNNDQPDTNSFKF